MKKQTAFTVTMLAAVVFGVGHPARLLGNNDGNNGWVKSEITFALDTNIINGCTSSGENVHIQGVGELSLKTRLSLDGTVEVRELDKFTGDGIGDTSGVQYKFKEQARINTSLGPNPDGTPFSYLERRKQKLIGMGGAPDQFITYYILLVLDGAGNVTTDIFDFNLECN